jgi:hypothetical protein
MHHSECPADITLKELCLWSDQSMGWEDPDLAQDYDGAVDKEIGVSTLFKWEYAPPVPERKSREHRALSFRRVRLPLSVIHPGLRDIEFWTLDLRSTIMLFIVLLVLVSFGCALFA